MSRPREAAGLYARWTEATATTTTTAPMKSDGGSEYPASAYAFVPDPAKPSTWKLRLWESPDAKETAKQVGAALAALSPGGFRGKKVAVPADALPAVKRKIFAAWKKVHPDDAAVPPVLKGSEALAGGRTFDEVRALVQDALTDLIVGDNADDNGYCPSVWVRDLTDEWVAYMWQGDCYRRDYQIADDGAVTLSDPTEVEIRTSYDPVPDAGTEDESMGAGGQPGASVVPMSEAADLAEDRIEGRVLEAKGADDAGGRIYRVRILGYGDSKNGRRYTEAVMAKAVRLYEGAKAYDHHRDDAELRSSTIAGLVGSYRNVEASTDGLEGDLCLLPSATHTAEALDASIGAQAEGLPPLVGISHDVMARYRPVVSGGRRVQEATEICQVNSADVVADPAAGGRATRMVAGGSGDLTESQGEEMKLEELLQLLESASPEQRAALAAKGFGAPVQTTEGTTPPDGQERDLALVGAGSATFTRESVMGRNLIRTALDERKLPAELSTTIVGSLPESFTEAQVVTAIDAFVRIAEGLERAGLAPKVGAVEVTADEADKKRERLDATFAGDYQKGYRSFKEAFIDISGISPRSTIDEDFNRRILRESIGSVPYDGAMRGTESVVASTWNVILGDSITRRMVAEYQQPSLQSWRQIVSAMPPINDFRTQRIERLGGYGVLPTVAEGAPYQPLTSPGNEEVTYSIAKKGGTEDLTLETIANDDLRAVVRIPVKLGLAAAQTLFRFVWDILDTNPNIYDSTALFVAGHNNTATNALSRSGVAAGRLAMRKQTAYGDTSDVLSITPKFLITVNTLEELAFEICTSAVAIPTAAPDGAASNTPNIHQGMDPIVVDYWSSATKWYLVADPARVPTIEIGFYRGQSDPELFVQNDPTIGAPFNADKQVFKIRHIYGGNVLDFRGFYRGNT